MKFKVKNSIKNMIILKTIEMTLICHRELGKIDAVKTALVLKRDYPANCVKFQK